MQPDQESSCEAVVPLWQSPQWWGKGRVYSYECCAYKEKIPTIRWDSGDVEFRVWIQESSNEIPYSSGTFGPVTISRKRARSFLVIGPSPSLIRVSRMILP